MKTMYSNEYHVVGMTNSGKTCLVTTILNKNSGMIADCANVTHEPQACAIPGLQCALVDYPGFNSPGEAKLLLQNKSDNPEHDFIDSNLEFEWMAYRDAKDCKCHILVVDANDVPSGITLNCIQFLKLSGKPILAVINKGGLHRGNKDHVQQYINFFENNKIDYFEWDLLYDSYMKIPDFFLKISSTINDTDMYDMANAMRTEYDNRTHKIAALIERTYNDVFSHTETAVSDNTSSLGVAQRHMAEYIENRFLIYSKDLYEALGYPSAKVEAAFEDKNFREEVKRILHSAKEKRLKNTMDGVGAGVIGGIALGSFEALIVAGNLALAGATGGLSLVILPVIFGTGGAVIGGICGARQNEEDTTEVSINYNVNQMKAFLYTLVANAVIAARCGFLGGRGGHLELTQSERLADVTHEVENALDSTGTSWSNANQEHLVTSMKALGL